MNALDIIIYFGIFVLGFFIGWICKKVVYQNPFFQMLDLYKKEMKGVLED